MSSLWILLTLLPVLGAAERFNCKGRILGAYYADAKSGCKAFHVCVRVAGGGIRDFRFFCPPGTLFHQEAQTCTDWGDDDPLACPADIYDGQFDLYRIGSGFDTRKISSPSYREEEPEFGLQRAETGDRRLSQSNGASNGPASDLRAAHSSDFFTGQRDRGRDDAASSAPSAPVASHAPPPAPRQSFRRATTPYTTPSTTQYTTPSSIPPQQSNPPQFETSKRKFIRKRPIYPSTPVPQTFAPNTQSQQPYQEQQQNFNRRQPPQNRPSYTTPNVPIQFREFKDEYVEVSRVTPKQNRFFGNSPTATPFAQSTQAPNFNKKEGLVELYNYEAQSTPGLTVQNENRPYKVRNGFNVQDVPLEQDFARNKKLNNNNFNNNNNYNNNNYNRVSSTTTVDYNAVSRSGGSSTPSYKNFNSVSYESEKNNFAPFAKNNYVNNPTTVSTTTTTVYTTQRPEPPANLNTVAYNTNIGFQAQSNNFAESDEDDGQYRPPQGEDDGQYRPELYEKELLSGAHSLNIAASGNRLQEDKKTYSKSQSRGKSQTAVPRPFRPAPTPTVTPAQTTRVPETIYTTTQVPQTINTQRTFDYFQTYTTTSRPSENPGNNIPVANNALARSTTSAPRIPESRPTRPHNRPPPTQTPTFAPLPPSHPPHFAKPSNNKEDTSYDYAYYDSDPGFSEYDHIEEFGRTKKRA
ncbi:hypothetical protein O3G_MSEX004449 [Manduca sexta]|uniref:Chitin-binding type-2 domain-containing protein n=1 Tax=Manduca sexta TaxID=7130 RepID=A0A921YWM4_MANSE|nr:hypothetical protein O3G_MSEX004449 [Manduca sexta]KAG6446379.1 hypothetical protein O3G_MSEX004449 [Manduca sexta]KAG6446380.1 hypothetical protein O3G_MSEX004449 [Manduca sexta]